MLTGAMLHWEIVETVIHDVELKLCSLNMRIILLLRFYCFEHLIEQYSFVF